MKNLPKIEILHFVKFVFFCTCKYNLKGMISLHGFSIQCFSICLFYYHRSAFVFEFQHISKWKIKHLFRSYRLYEGKKCMDIFLTHLETRIWRVSQQICFWNWLFWITKHLKLILQQGKTTFFLTKNITFLKRVRSLNLRFGVHLHVQVRY